METYDVKILQMRKRLGIKEISATSMDAAEFNITQLLKEYLNLEEVTEKIVYIYRSETERKFKLQLCDYSFTVFLLPLE